MKKTNILSYFIKDIKDRKDRKDRKELRDYRQINSDYDIKIAHINSVLYIYNRQYKHIYDFVNNISKSDCLSYINSNRKFIDKKTNHKYLFYNKDNSANKRSFNYIEYNYIYYKNMRKIDYKYRINYKIILSIVIKYYNRLKYMYYNRSKYMFCNTYKIVYDKYKSQIFIVNKYELQYISRFFYLYFDI